MRVSWSRRVKEVEGEDLGIGVRKFRKVGTQRILRERERERERERS